MRLCENGNGLCGCVLEPVAQSFGVVLQMQDPTFWLGGFSIGERGRERGSTTQELERDVGVNYTLRDKKICFSDFFRTSKT